MGLRDAEEMLEAAKTQSVHDEREIARLRAELDAAAQLIAGQAETLQEQAGLLFRAGEQHALIATARRDLEQQIERVRGLAREAEQDGWTAAGLYSGIFAIVGRYPAPSPDEHDRHA